MGTTFINLQLKAEVKDIPGNMIPKGYTCVQTAQEWVSVYETENSFAWGRLCKLGRELSKELKVPVIAVRYFDDDEFSMSLILEGKTCASYQAGTAGSFCSGSTKWLTGLKLSDEEASAFRYLLKKEMTAGESIGFFSRLFGAELYSDLRLSDETDRIRRKDTESLIREIKEEKQRTKIKNETRAKLISEIPGLFESYDETTGILKMVYPDDSGEFSYRHVHCMELCREGLLEVYDFQYPPDLFLQNSRSLRMDYEGKLIHVMDTDGYYDLYDMKPYEKNLSALMEVPKERLTEDRISPADVAPVYTRHVIEAGRYKYFGRYASGEEDQLKKVDLATSGKTYAEKNIVAVYRYEKPDRENAFWSCEEKIPAITEKGIMNVHVLNIREPRRELCDVRFFDKELNLLRKEEIPMEDKCLFQKPFCYCEAMDCIYIGNRKIDLKTHEVWTGSKELQEADRLFIHYSVKNEGFLYAVRGSSLYVFDLDMKLLSCHRLKGRILYFYEGKEGNVRLLTAGGYVFDERRPDKKSAVRIYEIEH